MVVFTKRFGTLDPHLPIVWDKVPKNPGFFDTLPNPPCARSAHAWPCHLLRHHRLPGQGGEAARDGLDSRWPSFARPPWSCSRTSWPPLSWSRTSWPPQSCSPTRRLGSPGTRSGSRMAASTRSFLKKNQKCDQWSKYAIWCQVQACQRWDPHGSHHPTRLQATSIKKENSEPNQTTKTNRHQCKKSKVWTETVIYIICSKLVSHISNISILLLECALHPKKAQLLIWRVMLLRTCWKWILNVKYVENTRALIILIEKWKWFFVKAAFDILKGKEIHLRSC